MSYYRYITGVYKSYWPELNRTLRSSSVPRHVPQLDTARYSRASSVPPLLPSSSSASTPFLDRARSVPRQGHTSQPRYTKDYRNYDYKMMDYMHHLGHKDSVRSFLSQSRNSRTSTHSNRFSSRYNYYDGDKHSPDYLYPITNDVLGRWKHYHLSADTLNTRNIRAKSPLVTRELDRYFEPRRPPSYRHYNYRPVPYFGGSDAYQYVLRMVQY